MILWILSALEFDDSKPDASQLDYILYRPEQQNKRQESKGFVFYTSWTHT